MAERNFIVLRYEGKVPAMAGCEKCKRKFFTPTTYTRDVVGAEEYLFGKFDHHNCEAPPKAALRGDSTYWRDNRHRTR